MRLFKKLRSKLIRSWLRTRKPFFRLGSWLAVFSAFKSTAITALCSFAIFNYALPAGDFKAIFALGLFALIFAGGTWLFKEFDKVCSARLT